MKALRDVSLRTKITLAISALFVVCIGAIAAWAVILFEEERKNSLSLETFGFVSAMAENIDTKLDLLQHTVIQVAATVPPRALQNFDAAQKFLDEQTALHALFDNGLFLVSLKGRLMGESPARPDRLGSDVSSREHFQKAVATRKPVISRPYRSVHNPGLPAVIMSAPIFNPAGELIGILQASINLLGSNMLANLSEVRFGKTGYLFLGDGRQTMISHPDRSRIMGPLAKKGQNLIVDRVLDENWEGASETVNSLGNPMFSAAKRLKSTGWIIGVNLPLAEFYAPIREAKRYFLWSIALGTAIVLVLVWPLLHRFISPLSSMTRQIMTMASEPVAHKYLAVQSVDEIGVLATAFNRMLAKLLGLNTELENRVAESTRAFQTIAAREDQIRQLAFSDPLTGLPNRRLLVDRLNHVLVSSMRKRQQGALLFLDLDNFKSLNDTRGHDVGDQLLRQVAQRLTSRVREGDTVARFGGDEFVVVLEDLGETLEEAATQATIVAEKIIAVLRQPYQLTGFVHASTPSVGITLFSAAAASADELLKQADMAMYQAKKDGRNTLCFFDPAMQAAISARVALESDLREAIRLEQFFFHYQAQVDDKGRLTGAEALVRWRHPVRGLTPPLEFIALAEETELILPLGLWILQTACIQLADWASRPETAHLSLSVNVSARQFRHPDFISQVVAMLEQTGANPEKLKMELTESLMLEDVEESIARMNALKTLGVSFSLDDFGTGYSSLAYLKRLPLDQLKIDRSFVRDLLTDPNDEAIARAVIALTGSLKLAVIAEGVETREQHDLLIRLGCHAFQGYYFGRPGPLEDIEALLGTKEVRHS